MSPLLSCFSEVAGIATMAMPKAAGEDRPAQGVLLNHHKQNGYYCGVMSNGMCCVDSPCSSSLEHHNM